MSDHQHRHQYDERSLRWTCACGDVVDVSTIQDRSAAPPRLPPALSARLEAIGLLVQALEERDLLERTQSEDTGATPADTEAARLDGLDAVACLLGDFRLRPCVLCGQPSAPVRRA